jgi:hypothetical protein
MKKKAAAKKAKREAKLAAEGPKEEVPDFTKMTLQEQLVYAMEDNKKKAAIKKAKREAKLAAKDAAAAAGK